MTESWIFQREETRNLERLVVAHQTAIVDTSPAAEVRVKIQPDGLIGRISVFRPGVSVIVMEGTDEPDAAAGRRAHQRDRSTWTAG
jgi:hypothetical protein